MEFEEISAANIGVIREIGSECSFVSTAGKGLYLVNASALEGAEHHVDAR